MTVKLFLGILGASGHFRDARNDVLRPIHDFVNDGIYRTGVDQIVMGTTRKNRDKSVLQDELTERKKDEALRAGQSRVLEMIAAGEPLSDILTTLLLLIESQSEGMLSSILLLCDDGMHVRHGAAPSLPDSYIKAIDGAMIGPQAGSCGTAMYLGKPVVVTDILADPLWDDYRDHASMCGLRACWSTPILSSQGKVMGSFAMYYDKPRGPSLEEMRLNDIATHIAGIAIERERAEESLRQSEERYKALVTASTQLVWRTDERGEALSVTSAWEELTGQNHEELRNFGWINAIHPDDRDHCQHIWKQALQTKSLYENEFRVKTRDSGYRTFQSRGVPIFAPDGRVREWVGTNIDITERKQAEEARRELEARNQATLRAIPDLMFLLSVDGVFLDYHAKSPDDLLFPPEEFLGKNMREVMPTELVENFASCFRRASESDELQALEYQLTNRGRSQHFEARVARCGSDRILVIVREITERKRAEDALRQSEEELRISHEHIRELAGRVMTIQEDERRRISREIHDDLNQKVAAISISLSNIKRQLAAPPVAITCLLDQAQEFANELSEGLRQMSHRLHPAVLEHAGIAAALKTFVSEFSRLEKIEILLNLPDTDEIIPQDIALCLYRVAQESLRNIARHSGAKSAEMTLSLDGRVVRLLIKDEGCGFDLRREHLRGGLGLISMEERARLVQGTLQVSAEPGRGTTVIASVPLKKERF